MWQLILERLALELASEAQRRTAKEFGKRIAGEILGTEVNKDEAYADRIKREFRLRDYDQAGRSMIQISPIGSSSTAPIL